MSGERGFHGVVFSLKLGNFSRVSKFALFVFCGRIVDNFQDSIAVILTFMSAKKLNVTLILVSAKKV